jgi:hypothetical protein
VLAANQQSPVGIATDEENLYWVNKSFSTYGQIVRLSKDGGSPAVLASMQYLPTWIAATGGTLYWTNFSGEVVKLPLDGGAAVDIIGGAASQMSPWAIAVNGPYVFWTDVATGDVMEALR